MNTIFLGIQDDQAVYIDYKYTNIRYYKFIHHNQNSVDNHNDPEHLADLLRDDWKHEVKHDSTEDSLLGYIEAQVEYTQHAGLEFYGQDDSYIEIITDEHKAIIEEQLKDDIVTFECNESGRIHLSLLEDKWDYIHDQATLTNLIIQLKRQESTQRLHNLTLKLIK